MSGMTKSSINRHSAEQHIWKACTEVQGHLPASKFLEVALDMLLWARWIPSSEGETIGFFDAMHSLSGLDEWELIVEIITERSGAHRRHTSMASRMNAEGLERMRASLLPIGRVVNGSDPLQTKAVIDAMAGLFSDENGGYLWSGSPSLQSLWEALLAYHPQADVACLYKVGVTAVPGLGIDHPLLYSCPNPELEYWIRGLLSLYPKFEEPASLVDHESWSIGIVAAAWGEKIQDLLVDDPWLPPLPLNCPAAIRDVEARRVYAAHQRCNDSTYALVSLGMSFRTSKDMEFFREELVRKDWLDAVIALPTGALSSTALKSMLLVLKKRRPHGAPIIFISAEELLPPSKERGLRQIWDATATKELACMLSERKESSCSRLVTAEEMEANGFSFQVSRYLRTEADLTLQGYIESRVTVQLGDLAEIKRPVASIGRQEVDGVEVREVTPGDIDDSGQLHQGSKVIRLPEAALAKGRQQLLEPGDVLLSIKGGLGKVAVVQDLENPTVPGQAFCVVRLRPNAPLTPAALVQYLRSAVGQTLLNKAGQGAAVSFVPMGEVKGLPVVIPSARELQRAESLEQESVALSHEVEALSRQLQQLSRQGWMEDLPPKLVNSGEEVSS
jgi:type I restriction enzyme M protein